MNRPRRKVPSFESLENRKLLSVVTQGGVLAGKVHGSNLISDATISTLGPRGLDAAFGHAVSEGTK